MILKVKKLHQEAIVPKFALHGDAGMDIFSIENVSIHPMGRISCSTGIALKIPNGHAGLIWDKSGISHGSGVKTLGGVIDENYTGEIKVGLINLSNEVYTISKGQKIAQILIQKVEQPDVEETGELEETNRGENGFGSTGLK